MATKTCFIMGYPSAGKTTFIAALWQSLKPNSVDTKLQLNKFAGNQAYLTQIGNDWLSGKVFNRTLTNSQNEALSISLVDSQKNEIVFSFSDFSGEMFNNIYVDREINLDLKNEIFNSHSFVLFVSPKTTNDPVNIAALNLGTLCETESETKTDYDKIEHDSTAAKLVELLQIIDYLCQRKNMKFSVVVSAWDTRAAFSEVLCLIFEISNEYIAEQIYSAFGDFSITTYFTWLSDKKNFNKNNWLLICKSNPRESLCLLKAASNADSELFYKLLQILNPWNKSMCLVEAVTLEDLYRKYCQSGNIPDLNDLFAKFVLQVMISTKIKFSDELSCFAFMRVHKILESPNFDTSFWNAISPHLPEVKWYNSWDKCKRLRKFAKKEGYTNIFI